MIWLLLARVRIVEMFVLPVDGLLCCVGRVVVVVRP